VARDIDRIIDRLKAELPDLRVTQLQVTYELDDDGLWFFTTHGKPGEVQIESPSGMCPFIIESTLNDRRQWGNSVDQVVSIVKDLYSV
jgi:hypothetical protein